MKPAIRGTVFVLCLLPFVYIVYVLSGPAAGPDPAEFIMHITGEWGARCLLLSLLISPLRKWTGWGALLKLRRMLGLYAFFYACIHLACFAHFYVGWTLPIVIEELLERPYIALGFLAWLLMLPLALTSNRSMQRRLRKNWQRLHRLVYLVAVLVFCHILWQARSDLGEALLYFVLFGWMLVWRYFRYRESA